MAVALAWAHEPVDPSGCAAVQRAKEPSGRGLPLGLGRPVWDTGGREAILGPHEHECGSRPARGDEPAPRQVRDRHRRSARPVKVAPSNRRRGGLASSKPELHVARAKHERVALPFRLLRLVRSSHLVAAIGFSGASGSSTKGRVRPYRTTSVTPARGVTRSHWVGWRVPAPQPDESARFGAALQRRSQLIQLG